MPLLQQTLGASVQHPGTHTLTVVEQQLHGGLTHNVVMNGGGGQQQPSPAWTDELAATTSEPAVTAANNNDPLRNMMFSPW